MSKVQSILMVAAALSLAATLAGCQSGGAGSGTPAQPATQVSYAGNGAIEVVSTAPAPSR
jgi:hypothetical protein